MKISVASGGFDPLHSGHIQYLKASAKIGDHLVVALNSDDWLIAKKGKNFLPFAERKLILEHMEMVDEVIEFDDDEIGSCKNALYKVKEKYPTDEVIFCNGGDRDKDNIPELEVENVTFKFGVGGDSKTNSSSWILKDWHYGDEDRVWGSYKNLLKESNLTVKEIMLEPGKGMSLQKHSMRSEVWFVSKGECYVNHSKESPEETKEIFLPNESVFTVNQGHWHQLFNKSDQPCHIIEIQYGDKTTEDDIERHSYFKNN